MIEVDSFVLNAIAVSVEVYRLSCTDSAIEVASFMVMLSFNPIVVLACVDLAWNLEVRTFVVVVLVRGPYVISSE